MQTFKPSSAELDDLKAVATKLKQANKNQNAASTEVDAAKKHFADWLKNNRGLDLETLAIGEMVMIEGVILLEVGSQNKFDAAAYSLAHPEEFAQFKKDFPVKKFKPLV